jgi:hypothetical protein
VIVDEKATGRIVVDERHLHSGELVHGGAWVALADSVLPGRRSGTSRPATTSRPSR